MRNNAAERQLEQIARTVASEQHVAMLWRENNWEWYVLLRDAVLRMLRRGEHLELRHLQFAWFVRKFLSHGCFAALPEETRFGCRSGTQELGELVRSLPSWTVDDCEIFEQAPGAAGMLAV